MINVKKDGILEVVNERGNVAYEFKRKAPWGLLITTPGVHIMSPEDALAIADYCSSWAYQEKPALKNKKKRKPVKTTVIEVDPSQGETEHNVTC